MLLLNKIMRNKTNEFIINWKWYVLLIHRRTKQTLCVKWGLNLVLEAQVGFDYKTCVVQDKSMGKYVEVVQD